jgi:hypothetical protein
MKNEGKLLKKIGGALKLGQATERLWFFVFILILASHIFGCLWIFVGKNYSIDGVSWISENFSGEKTGGQLYLASFYFTTTTITTVGYGDIRGNNILERIICVFLHLLGVLSYAYASGALTSIIQNYDKLNEKNSERIAVLNRI